MQLPIWVTEWACQDFTGSNQQCDDADVKSYMNITQSFMEKTDWCASRIKDTIWYDDVLTPNIS